MLICQGAHTRLVSALLRESRGIRNRYDVLYSLGIFYTGVGYVERSTSGQCTLIKGCRPDVGVVLVR